MSLNYDLDLKNELDVITAFQWVGISLSILLPVGLEPVPPLIAPTNTFIGSFNGGLLTPISTTLTLLPGTYQIGTRSEPSCGRSTPASTAMARTSSPGSSTPAWTASWAPAAWTLGTKLFSTRRP